MNIIKSGFNLLKKRISRSSTKNIKTLLVNPPYQRLRGILSYQLPMGLLYLSAVLKNQGFDVMVFNGENATSEETLQEGYIAAFDNFPIYKENLHNYSHPAWKDYISTLVSYNPDIVGFSAMTPSYPLSLIMAKETKKHLPESIIVMGGPHPTLCLEDVTREKVVDWVIPGEAEETLLEFVSNIDRGRDRANYELNGIAYSKNGNFVKNPGRPLITDLDNLPIPAYETLKGHDLTLQNDRFGIIVSRGCPYRCNFCVDHLIWRNSSRFRKADGVLRELYFLKNKYNLGSFIFQQDSFLNKKRLAEEICTGIIKNKLDISFACAARIDQIDANIVEILKKAGLTSIILGIESGSQKMLDYMGKKITINQVERSVQIIKNAGIKVAAFFMIGLPDETEEDILATIKFIKELPLDLRSLSVFTPLPGSNLYFRAMELGMLPEKIDWGNFDYQSPENYFSKNIKKERFKELLYSASQLVDSLNRA